MTTLVATAIAWISFAGIAFAGPPISGAREETAAFVCRPSALTPEERRRHFDEVGPALRARKTAVRELPNGYELTFPGDSDTVRLVSEWTVAERACCPFFEITLELGRDGGPVRLALTGRDGVKAFLESEAAEWLE